MLKRSPTVTSAVSRESLEPVVEDMLSVLLTSCCGCGRGSGRMKRGLTTSSMTVSRRVAKGSGTGGSLRDPHSMRVFLEGGSGRSDWTVMFKT